MFGSEYKRLYEMERARSARLEEELRQLNDQLRTDSVRQLAEVNRALKVASETIATLRRGGVAK